MGELLDDCELIVWDSLGASKTKILMRDLRTPEILHGCGRATDKNVGIVVLTPMHFISGSRDRFAHNAPYSRRVGRGCASDAVQLLERMEFQSMDTVATVPSGSTL